jgi:hypothetical protein
MKAKLLVRRRVVLSESAFAEVVVWEVPHLSQAAGMATSTGSRMSWTKSA